MRKRQQQREDSEMDTDGWEREINLEREIDERWTDKERGGGRYVDRIGLCVRVRKKTNTESRKQRETA